MSLSVVAGTGPHLGAAVAARLGTALVDTTIERFPDGECHVTSEAAIRGHDVYVIQPIGPRVDEHLVELLMLADAAAWRRGSRDRRDPYLAYARQDRRTRTAESVGVRVVADLLGAVHIDRVLVVDPHTATLRPCSQCRSRSISAVSVLAARCDPWHPRTRLSSHPISGRSSSPNATPPHSTSRSSSFARLDCRVRQCAREVVGNVEGRVPIVIDDMISTAGTIVTATDSLIRRGCQPSVLVAATHALLVGPAIERLRALPLRRLVVTNSLPAPEHLAFPHEVADITDLLAGAMGRLHNGGTATRHRP